MRDEDFDYFISKFGEAGQRVGVPASALETWRSKLPDQLLAYWQEEGWCSYADGLLWTVNPEQYEDLVDEWLDGSPLERTDSFHVIARSAFGDLYLCGQSSGRSATICCPLNAISALVKELRPKTPAGRDSSIRSFFCGSLRGDYDLLDETGRPLFDRALAKFGPLGADEMYGFEPALVAGGKMRLENLRKVKLDQHLSILRQLAAPTIPFSNIDIEKLLNS